SLLAETDEPTTEVFVINGRYARVAAGLQRVEAELPPGLYTVRFKAGDAITETDADLAPGSAPMRVTMPRLRFSSPAPVKDTSTTHEYHVAGAEAVSHRVHVPIGPGSQI